MQYPPQSWAKLAAWLAFLGALGPIVWRLLMLAGVDVGWPLQGEFRTPAGLGYVGTLIVLEFGCAFLTFGLVQRWGEVWPAWLPGIGGRGIPWRGVVAVATIGAVLLTAIVGFFVVLFAWLGPHEGWRTPMTGTPTWAGWLMGVFYVPSLLWPLGLWAAIVGFWRRHAHASH